MFKNESLGFNLFAALMIGVTGVIWAVAFTLSAAKNQAQKAKEEKTDGTGDSK